jgi:hypothetical protein
LRVSPRVAAGSSISGASLPAMEAGACGRETRASFLGQWSSTSVRVPGRVVRRGRCLAERWRVARFARLEGEDNMLFSSVAHRHLPSAMRPRVAVRFADERRRGGDAGS